MEAKEHDLIFDDSDEELEAKQHDLAFDDPEEEEETAVEVNNFETVQASNADSTCNTLICLQLAMHRVSSNGTHRVATHSRKMRFSACGTHCRCC